MDAYMWYMIGYYGGGVLLLGARWLARRRGFPHRHDGYVAMSGHAWPCSQCGRLPEVTGADQARQARWDAELKRVCGVPDANH
jgi:hypothetical protein